MSERKICDSLGCFSTALARSIVTKKEYCIQCATKIAGQFGPETIETIPGEKFPWDYPSDKVCEHCGVKFNYYITSHTGDCPACKKPIKEIKYGYKGMQVL